MQFEGNWAAVADVIVDKVGKYAHVIGSPLDTASTPVVMDVSLDVRTKVGLSIPYHRRVPKGTALKKEETAPTLSFDCGSLRFLLKKKTQKVHLQQQGTSVL